MAMDWDNFGAHSVKRLWTDREGVTHLIKNMDDNYLLNCIRYINFYGGKLTPKEVAKLTELENEYSRRHDGVLPWAECAPHVIDEIKELIVMREAIESRLKDLAYEIGVGDNWRTILKNAGYRI